jgi:asparagine synthase (glutamine-hydrolysing)
MHPEVRAELASGELAAALPLAAAEHAFSAHLDRTDAVDQLNRMLYVDTKLWLPDDLLARGDKMSMACSLEARVPLLDHALVEFAAGLPRNLKVRRISRKYLLRKVARDLLPEPILRRRKKGFPVPMAAWLRGGGRPLCRDLLSPDAIRRRGILSPCAVSRLLDEHESRAADHGAVLWALLSVELWHRLFIDGDASVVHNREVVAS